MFSTRTRIQVCNRYGSRTENIEFILVFPLLLRACIGYETNVSCIRIWIPNRKCWYCIGFRTILCIRTRILMCCGYGSRIENVDFILAFVLFLHTDWDDESDAKPKMLILYWLFHCFCVHAWDMKPKILILYWFFVLFLHPAAAPRSPRRPPGPPLGTLIAFFLIFELY